MLTDFEIAAQNAIKSPFPNSNIVGCYFHLGQSVWRTLCDKGLRNQYVSNENIRITTKMVLALAFLPVNSVVDAFDQLRDEDDTPAEL